MSNPLYAELAARLIQEENLIITGHIDPDSDCIGSMLGIYHTFNGSAKGWQLVLEGDIPAYISFLPGTDLIKKPEDIINPKGILLLDCNEAQRAGDWLLPYWRELPAYILDHHEGEADIAEIVICEPEASACGELAAAIAMAGELEIDREAALCFYTAIAGDTGSFRYLNTTPVTHRVAAMLLEKGIDIEEVRINLYENLSHANLKMLSAALGGAEYYFQDKLCLMALTLKDKEKYNAQKSDCSSIVNYALAAKGVKAGILLDEFEDFIKISLRCRSGYQVNILAAEFGGGGHVLAAGCRIDAPLNEAKNLILNKAGEMLFNFKRV